MRSSPRAGISNGIGSLMAVLRERKVWRKPKAAKPARAVGLDSVQRDNVLAALFTVRARFRGWAALGRALGMPPMRLHRVIRGDTAPEAELGVGIARIAGVTPGEVISGAFAKPRVCLWCGFATPPVRFKERAQTLVPLGLKDGSCWLCGVRPKAGCRG